MYSVVHHTEVKDRPFLRRNNGIIERVTQEGEATFFCKDAENRHILDHIVIVDKDYDCASIHRFKDGKMGEVMMSDWGNDDKIAEYTNFYADNRDSDGHSVIRRITRNGISWKFCDACTVKVKTSNYNAGPKYTQYFAADPDTGLIMTFDRGLVRPMQVKLYKVTHESFNMIFESIIETESMTCKNYEFLLDIKDLTIRKLNTQEYWQIVAQPKTLLTLCQKKISQYEFDPNQIPKEALGLVD